MTTDVKNDTGLGRLGEEQKATALVWMEEGLSVREIAAEMAKPEPEGFGLVVPLGALARTLIEWKREALLRSLREERRHADAVRSVKEELGEDFHYARQESMEERLFSEVSRTGDIRWLFRVVRLLEQHDARVARQEMAQARYDFNRGRSKGASEVEGAEPEAAEGPVDMKEVEARWEVRRQTFGGGETVGADGVRRTTLPPMQLPSGEMYYGPNGGVIEEPEVANGPHGVAAKDGGRTETEGTTGKEGQDRKDAERNDLTTDGTDLHRFPDGNGRGGIGGTEAHKGNPERVGTGSARDGRAAVAQRVSAEEVDLNAKTATSAKEVAVDLAQGVEVVKAPATVDAQGRPVTVRYLTGWVNARGNSTAMSALLTQVFGKERLAEILKRGEMIQVPLATMNALRVK